MTYLPSEWGKPPAISVYATTVGTTQIIPSVGTWITVNFPTENWDTNSFFTPATGHFFPTTAGYYFISARVEVTANYIEVGFAKNAAIVSYVGGSSSSWKDITCCAYMNGTSDYGNIQLRNLSMVTTILASATKCWFNCHYLGV